MTERFHASRRLRAWTAAMLASLLAASALQAASLDEVYREVSASAAQDRARAAQQLSAVGRDVKAVEQAERAAGDKVKRLRDEVARLEDQLAQASSRLEERREILHKERTSFDAVFESVDRHEALLRDLVLPTGLAPGSRTLALAEGHPAQTASDRPDASSSAYAVERIENLWLAQSEQIAATARIDEVQARIYDLDGKAQEAVVLRVGPFAARTLDGRWLKYLPAQRSWQVLARQPEAAPDALLLDPSFGPLTAKASERGGILATLRPAGVVGVFIVIVAAAALALGIWRWIALTQTAVRVRRQRDSLGRLLADNPLGRMLRAAREAPAQTSDQTTESLLDAALAAERPLLDKGIGTLAVLAGIPTLLGLLGTVSGMIETFSVMSEYGSNQPDLLAGGIAEALLTTEMGLVAAIPILLLHCAVKSRRRSILDVLEEEAALEAAGRSARAQGE